MIREIECDVFDAEIDGLAHCANCQCTMGSGIAKAVKEFYPEAYAADLATGKGNHKLGEYSCCTISDRKNRRNPTLETIYNLYGQNQYGTHRRQLNYEALYTAMESIEKVFGGNQLGIPYKIGCDRAGGNFVVVRAMIDVIFEKSPFDVLICKLPL
jgi:O-acetyl-ADP-ribose deacetylase (regulator of RNase III)